MIGTDHSHGARGTQAQRAAVAVLLGFLLGLGLPVTAARAAGETAPAASAAPQPGAGAATAALAGSGLPVPRFVSLKSDRVNMRNGPGTDYPTAWVYRRAGLPVEVIREFEGWRQVRDSEGATGWILQSFLSGRRTVLIAPWEVKPDKAVPQIELKASDSTSARPLVKVEAGVIAHVLGCDGKWCQVAVETYRGYVEQKQVWGVYEGEQVR